MNKVKFNRFEKYIPEPSDGILLVSPDESQLKYTISKDIVSKGFRNNVYEGFRIIINDKNHITITKGKMVADRVRPINKKYEGNKLDYEICKDIWGMNCQEKFDIDTYKSIDNGYYYDDESHYVGDYKSMADYSESKYNIPTMTSNTTPYGKAYTNQPYSLADYAPWYAFSEPKDGAHCFASDAVFPVTLEYAVSIDGDKWVKPNSFKVKNRLEITGNPTSEPLTFKIQASKIWHPYDEKDWVTLVDVDNVNIKHNLGAGVETVYNVNTNEYYRNFRMFITSRNGEINYVCVQKFDVNGVSNYDIPYQKNVKQTFITKYKNDETNEQFTRIISSRKDVPVLNKNYTLLDYLPIEYAEKQNVEINKAVYLENDEDTVIDLTKFNIQKNKTYMIYGYESGSKCLFWIEDSINVFPLDKVAYKLIGSFNTDDGYNIISYSPHYDLNNTFLHRHIIAEQQGKNGYRIYSDGWKEQWGVMANPIFPIAFEQVPHIVERGATNVTKTNMTIPAGYWFAKGY